MITEELGGLAMGLGFENRRSKVEELGQEFREVKT